MSAPVKAADIAAAYQKTGSVWLAGASLGISGQRVQQVLRKLGIPSFKRRFTDADKARLIADYERHANAGTVATLAAEMGRTRQFLARKAKDLGLTDRGRPRPYFAESASARFKAHQAEHGHPRGFKGGTHSAETRAKCGAASQGMWDGLTEDERADLTGRRIKTRIARGNLNAHPRLGCSWKSGWREIGGQRCFFRSRWEANYARYLEWLRQRGEILEWKHEPETFWFEAIKRGVRSYKPDFQVFESNGAVRYHEVKGWMDDRSKTCLARMGRYHPSVIMVLIDKKQYAAIAKAVSRLIVGWEEEAVPPSRQRLA